MASVNNETPPPPPPPHDVNGTGSRATPTKTPSVGDCSHSEIKEFKHKITEKLRDENLVLWRQQVEPVIKAHRLHHFLVDQQVPPRFLTTADIANNNENPAFQVWEAQDQILLSWLQTSLTTAIQTRVVGCNHSSELLDKIHSYFQKLGRTKIRQLRNELRTTQLENSSVKDYLVKIKLLVDSLAAVGSPISTKDHLDVILDGLPQEYDQIISLVESKFDDEVTVEEAELLLLAQEVCLNRYHKQTKIDSASVLLTHTPSWQLVAGNSGSTPAITPASTPIAHTTPDSHVEGYGYRGRGRGHGRGGRFQQQCQVCNKFGHIAIQCYHCFNQHYNPTAPRTHPYHPYTYFRLQQNPALWPPTEAPIVSQ